MLGVIMGVVGGLTGFTYMVPPLQNAIQKQLNSIFPNAPLPVRQLLTLRLTWDYSDEWFKERMAEIGYSSETADQYLQAYRFYPTATDIISLTTRGALWESSQRDWPNMFEPPDVAVEWAERAGLSRDILSKYWFAHFTQPSWFRLRDMYFRGLIPDDVMDGALEYQGYSEYWRPYMKQVMEATPTRVDVRRMHKMGVISDDEVYKYFRWRYYGDYEARSLQQWVIEYNRQSKETETDEFRTLTRSLIEKAYEDKLVNRDTASQMLQNIDYRPQDANLILQMVDYDLEKDRTDTQIDYLEQAVKGGKITLDEAIVKLNEMNLPSERITYLNQRWQDELEQKVEIPSKSDLGDMLANGIIGKDDYRDLMRKHGYSDKHINWYLQLVGA